MQTPRRSGQPINAGDFVFTTTFSRPIRTSCENVGTVLPSFARELFLLPAFLRHEHTRSQNAQGGCAALAGAQQNCARAHISAERQLRIRRTTSKKLRTHSRRLNSSSGFDSETLTRLFRGWRPIPAALHVPFRRSCSGTEDISFQLLEPRLLLSRSPIRHNKLPLTNKGV